MQAQNQLIRGVRAITQPLGPIAVTLGNFDGVHIGHQEIIRRACELARTRGLASVAFTFRPHPQVALKPQSAPALLMTYDEKIEALIACGLDWVIEEPFSREFSNISAEQFFMDVLVRELSAKAVVVGYDFAFGKERGGSLELLKACCARSGVECVIVEPKRVGEEVASSSKIRQFLLSGQLDRAEKLLTRPFSYRGNVVRGDGRGRLIGFPTANVKTEGKLVLPLGVYATKTRVGDQAFASVSNLGVRPTFKDDEGVAPLLETHLMDQTIDLYGSQIRVEFVAKIRDERKFSGVDALKMQIADDVGKARQILGI